jgi:predicted amidohydrolase YtcJ
MHPTRRALLRAAAALPFAQGGVGHAESTAMPAPQLILANGRITTLDRANPEAEAIAIAAGRVLEAGTMAAVMPLARPETQVIDLDGRRVIPGLNDSHTHLIRGGLNYNLELRWEGVPSVADVLRLLRAQADRTPAPQWVRVVGGWSEFQFGSVSVSYAARLSDGC